MYSQTACFECQTIDARNTFELVDSALLVLDFKHVISFLDACNIDLALWFLIIGDVRRAAVVFNHFRSRVALEVPRLPPNVDLSLFLRVKPKDLLTEIGHASCLS